MSKPSDYPLEQLATIKQKRLEEAEKTLKEKKILLEQEEKKLQDLIKTRDELKTHKDEKLQQLRNSLDEGTTSDKIQAMISYIKIVDEKLIIRERKVQDQQKNVDTAQKNVETAKAIVLKKQQEVEKIHLHKKEWKKEAAKEEQRIENIETDEIGSSIYTLKKPLHPMTQALKKKKKH
jgi:flagellar export protein FliJ